MVFCPLSLCLCVLPGTHKNTVNRQNRFTVFFTSTWFDAGNGTNIVLQSTVLISIPWSHRICAVPGSSRSSVMTILI